MTNKNENAQLAVLEKELEYANKEIDEIKSDIKDIKDQLQVYAGRWGILLMVGSALLFAVGFFKEWITKKLGMSG